MFGPGVAVAGTAEDTGTDVTAGAAVALDGDGEGDGDAASAALNAMMTRSGNVALDSCYRL